MSVFTPFRSKRALRTAVVTGTMLKLVPTVVNAQQYPAINLQQIGGQTPLTAYCDDSTAVQHAGASTNVSGNAAPLIQGNASTNPSYICAYDITTGNSSVSVKFVRGTSTDCSSNNAGITAIYQFSSIAGISKPNGGAPLFILPSSQSLCVNNGSTGYTAVNVTYVTK